MPKTMPNNELHGDEDLFEPQHYEIDEDRAHEDYIDRVFAHDRRSVCEALKDGFVTQPELVQKMTMLIAKARSEGNYPNV
jgi:pyridoxal/pyridoxine/pyridoxamine kinase